MVGTVHLDTNKEVYHVHHTEPFARDIPHAAHILAEGVVRLLADRKDDIRLMPVVEDEESKHLDGGCSCSHLRLVIKPDNKGGA